MRIGTRVLLVTALATVASVAGAVADRAGDAYDALTGPQRRLLAGSEARARADYNAAPEPFRRAFEDLTTRLSALLLSDPENGEVLGSALDLVESVEPPARQPAPGPREAARLALTPASGARDRLRRSVEFERVDGGERGVTFVHAGPPAIRIALDDPPTRALVTMLNP